jgi:hypothetical protein
MATATADPSSLTPAEGRVLPAFALIGWRWISRNPASAIAPILVPFIFLYFLRIISPSSLFPLEVIGAMLFTTQNIGTWVLGDSATWRIEFGLQDLFVASPMGKVRYLVGIAFSNMIAALPALVVLAGVLYFTLPVAAPWYAWLVLGGAIGVLWVLFSAIGVAISSRVTSQREIWPVGSLAFTCLGMLSPLYFLRPDPRPSDDPPALRLLVAGVRRGRDRDRAPALPLAGALTPSFPPITFKPSRGLRTVVRRSESTDQREAAGIDRSGRARGPAPGRPGAMSLL